jgi:hypothetical protein
MSRKLLVLLGTLLAAPLVRAQDTTLELVVDADTAVDRSRPTARLGQRDLRASRRPVRQVFLRFVVDGIGTREVKKAVLRLTTAPGRNAASRSGGTLHYLSDSDWTEVDTTWARRPIIDGPALATQGRVQRNQAVDFDVTDVVFTDGTYNFALVSAANDVVRYRSREAAAGQPRLVLTLGDPQEGSHGGEPVEQQVGFEDFAFGAGVEAAENRATAQKPESKLWRHDGLWWATLYRREARAYRIHRLDPASETWTDTGVGIDERPRSRQDVLWDGTKLYIASRIDGGSANRLYRYGYAVDTRTWVADAGFPVDIPGAGTESLTIAKDSTGMLWVAFTLESRVFVSHTLGDDALWVPPFVVPVPEGTTVHFDDIAGVQALDGQIGVFWSNQLAQADYFAVHTDGRLPADPTAWQVEVAVAGRKVADDHFNMKLASDGRLFVSIKTSRNSGDNTLIGLLVRSPVGVWSPLHQVSASEFGTTRPTCVLDEVAGRIHVFFSAGRAGIQMKTSDLDTIAFPSGPGTPFIASAAGDEINNATGSKQGMDATSGLVILASSPSRNTYWHNRLAPTEPADEPSTPAPAMPPPALPPVLPLP